jgi:hypothetical protein
VALVACAGLVGADFGDAHLSQTQGRDGGPVPTSKDSGVVVANDAGLCPAGLTNCGGICVDVNTDPDHCNACATACPSDPHGPAVCVQGACALACQSGWVRCGDACCSSSTGPDASTDADVGVDAGPPDTGTDAAPADPGIACGAAECPAGTSFCCASPLTGSSNDRCSTSQNDQCSWDMRCDDAADCTNGRVCCTDDSLSESFCADSCTQSQTQLCDPQVINECLDGLSCTATFSRNAIADSYPACQ